MQIRNFTQSDYEQIIHLANDFQNYVIEHDSKRLNKPFNSLEDCKKYVDQLIKDSIQCEGAFFVAETDGKIIGFIQGIVEQNDKDLLYALTHKAGAYGWIGELFVDSKFRSKGIARFLMDKIIAYFKEKGCIGVQLYVMADNKLAREVYAKYGFEERDLKLEITFEE